MPEEHVITDELNDMKEELGYSSIIQYCLDALAKSFLPYARLNPDNTISGKYAKEFTLARSCEGIVRSTGIHAAGLIVNSFGEDLGSIVPFIHQGTGAKANDKVLGFSGPELETMGCLKLDLLGLSALSKYSTMQTYVNTGRYHVYDDTVADEGETT